MVTEMKNLFRNQMLLQVIAVYSIYIIVGYFVERPYVAVGTSILGLIVGIIFAFRYTVPAYRVLILQERGEYGGHNSILGATEMAYGMVYCGVFKLLWIHFNHPESWTSTMASSLGLFMLVKGAFRLVISPKEAIDTHPFHYRYISITMWVIGIIVAFIAGSYFN
jgi:hypothetical protein